MTPPDYQILLAILLGIFLVALLFLFITGD